MKWLRKLTPVVVLLVLACLAGATDMLGPRVQELIGKSFSEWGEKLKPFLANILVAALVVSLANLLWEPIKAGIGKAMERSPARERARNVVLRVFQVVYWALTVFIALTVLSPELVSKFFIGVSMVGAAIAFALQGFARDLISGLLIDFSPHLNEGDEIEMVGLAVKGRVVDIGLLSTIVETGDEVITVANDDIRKRAVKVKKDKPPESRIIVADRWTRV